MKAYCVAVFLSLPLSSGFLTGCAIGRTLDEASGESAHRAAEKTPEQQKIESLETQLGQLQAKLEKMEVEIDTSKKSQRLTQARPGIVESTELVQSSVATSDPERGFTQDSAVLGLRQSKVLFDSEKYPEAILGFSTFVEKNSNHPLASQAQFYLADAYFLQNDFPIAEKEFRKLLERYPQSVLTSRAREKLKICTEKNTGKGTTSIRQKSDRKSVV